MGFSQFAAFLITFREAFEALLIVGIIVTYINKIGAHKWNKWVGVGVFFALLTSLGVAFIFQTVFDDFAGLKNQAYLRFGVIFVSVILLTHMVVWMAGQNKDKQGTMEAKLSKIVTTGSAINMIVHSYLVVMREAVETVFFFAAISGGDIGKAVTSWGALTGLVCALVVAFVVFSGAKRLPIGRFFKITGIFIILIAAGLLSQGIGALQDMGYMKSLYMTKGGQIGEVYNLSGILPEHPVDAQHYERKFGEKPLLSGQIGIFLGAMFGYTHNPSVEQFVGYWGYYLVAFLMAGLSARLAKRKNTMPVGNVVPSRPATHMKAGQSSSFTS